MNWPLAISPFHVHLIPVSVKDQVQINVAEELYQRLRDSGIEGFILPPNVRCG
jgi:prolyl-tRNA synthetase